MDLKKLCRKRSELLGPDRAVAAAVLLAITFLLLLIGFSGPSIDIRLPRLAGWIYIGIVMIIAAVVLVWLFSLDGKRKKSGRPGLRFYPGRNARKKSRSY
jgi:multisubunit Na+/H+ antiporter MnhB subunit